MKRLGAFLLALLLVTPLAAAEVMEDVSGSGVTVWRNHETSASDYQKMAIDYPTFQSDDEALAAYLTDQITDPILALRHLDKMADDSAYQNGATDTIRAGYYASLDFEGLLSVEATVSNGAAGSTMTDTAFFWRLIDLDEQDSLTVDQLFMEEVDVVEKTIRQTVYEQISAQNVLLETITGADDVPVPDSYYVTKDFLRTIYAAGALNQSAVVVDIPWPVLPLTPAAIIGGAADQTSAAADDAATGDPNFGAAGNAGDGEPTSPDDSPTNAPAVEPANAPAAAPSAQPTAVPAAQPQATAALDPNFSMPPVQTPTPMPLSGDDSITADVLVHGLWKPLGGDGSTYYQFTQSGQLLTITVTDYALNNGQLSGGALNGTVDIGSDSAFTLYDENGNPTGYVLNRMGEAVAPEELVTPSPTPVATPTPIPTATPTPAPTDTPVPTPVPTPTLSPYMEALSKASMLAPLADATFGKRQTLPVYSAPSADAFRLSNAQVDTDAKDEQLEIYGVTEDGGWVLVSYHIGGGGKGRVGYIDTSTLADPGSVARLNLIAMPMTLTKDCDGTDDPIVAQGKLRSFKAGDSVTLLAFMDSEWAYIETTNDDKLCRMFIPQTALMEE